MTKVSKWLIPAFMIVCPSVVQAQSCTSASCSAPDCTQANVLNALPAPSNTNATVTVTIPACAATSWTTNLTYSSPAAVTSLTIHGQTSCAGTGDPHGSQSLTCADNTIIRDNDTTHPNYLISITSKGFLRVTGLTIEEGNVAANKAGELALSAGNGLSFNGNGCLRVDHNHFNKDTNTTPGGYGSLVVNIGGCTRGIADHNLFQNTKGYQGEEITMYNGACSPFTTWASPTGFGTADFFFVEQNTFLNNSNNAWSQADDCSVSGKAVFRFNTLNNIAIIQTHSTGEGTATNITRGCRAYEVYGNSWTYNLGGPSNNIAHVFNLTSGVAMVWGNVVNQQAGMTNAGYSQFVQLTDCRSPSPKSRCNAGENEPPDGWGWCQPGNSASDGNAVSGNPYPCIDQATRGQSDLLTGSAFPSIVDSVTGTQTWPRNLLEPLYFFLNSVRPLTSGNWNGYVAPLSSYPIHVQNRDYYVSADPSSGTDCTGFTGATGVGCGPLASRPATCAAGPGGTYGQSPTGSYGVAYWAMDEGSWNQSGNGAGQGQLYICTGTNTWTAAYMPYPYPHPLALSSGTPSPGPAAPTNLKVTIN